MSLNDHQHTTHLLNRYMLHCFVLNMSPVFFYHLKRKYNLIHVMHMVWEFTCDLWTMNNPESGKMLSPYQISCAYIFTLLFFLNLENAQIHRGHKKSFLLKMWSKNNDQELLHWTEIWIQWWKWKWKKISIVLLLVNGNGTYKLLSYTLWSVADSHYYFSIKFAKVKRICTKTNYVSWIYFW